MNEACLIITAAGMSTRHPPNKLLKQLNNRSVIERTVSTFLGFADIYIVTGYQSEMLTSVVESKFKGQVILFENRNFPEGLSSSIKTALLKIRDSYHYYGFCNGDKPFIKIDTVKLLMTVLDTQRPLILAPSYQSQIGHPVFFSGQLLSELKAISGDRGARGLIQKYRAQGLFPEVEDEGVITDLDSYLDRPQS